MDGAGEEERLKISEQHEKKKKKKDETSAALCSRSSVEEMRQALAISRSADESRSNASVESLFVFV